PLVGVEVIAAGHMVVVRFRRAIAPTAGATVYSRAMKISAQPADERASATLGTEKKRMITCGRPAVPIMSDSVNRNMLSLFVVSAVYDVNPSSVTTWSSFASSEISLPPGA